MDSRVWRRFGSCWADVFEDPDREDDDGRVFRWRVADGDPHADDCREWRVGGARSEAEAWTLAERAAGELEPRH